MKDKAKKLAKAKKELDDIDAAISKIVNGSQSYGIGSRNTHRASLETLLKRKDLLEERVNALEGGSGRFKRVVPVDR